MKAVYCPCCGGRTKRNGDMIEGFVSLQFGRVDTRRPPAAPYMLSVSHRL